MQRAAEIARNPVAYGLLGVFLVYFALGVLNVFTTPLWKPDDEPRHAAYALYVAEGRIPLVTEVMPTDRLGIEPLKRTNIVCAANHPPLYYLIVGPPILWGSNAKDYVTGMYVARLLTLVMGAVGLVAAWKLLRELLPERPGAALLALAFMPLFPSFLNYCSLVYNDALAFASATGLLLFLTRAFTRGPSRSNLAWFALWAAIVGLTRFSGLLVLAPALVGLVAAHLLRGEGTPAQRVVRGSGEAALVLAVVVATSGWFYWRNYSLYGDVTGAQEIFDTLERKTREPFYYHLFTGKPWAILHDHLWTRLGGTMAFKGSAAYASRAWTAVAVVGLVWSVNRLRQTGQTLSWRDPRVAAFAFGFLALSAVTLPVFEFYARGGNIYPRYYFPVLWMPALVAAIGFSSFKSFFPAMWALVFNLVLSLLAYMLYVDTHVGVRGQPRDYSWTRAFDRYVTDLPWAWVYTDVLLIAAVLGATLVMHAVITLHRPMVEDSSR
jgi:hypothetical protein